MKKTRKSLEAGLAAHYAALQALFPGIPSNQLQPKDAATDPLPLASHFTQAEHLEYGLEHLHKLETEVLIGHLFDTLSALKYNLGFRSFVTRHAKQVHGWVGTLRSRASIRNAEARVKAVAAVYKRSYNLLLALAKATVDNKGLQPVVQGDLKMLSDWLEEERYSGSKSKNSPLPWFWTLMSLSTDGKQASDEGVQAWNREGTYIVLVGCPATSN